MTPTATDQTNRMRHADQPNRMGHDAPSQTRFRLGSMSSSSCAHHVTPFLPLLRRTTAAMEIALVKSPSSRRRRPVSMVIRVPLSKTRFLARIDNYPLAKWPLPRVALWSSSPATVGAACAIKRLCKSIPNRCLKQPPSQSSWSKHVVPKQLLISPHPCK